LPSIKPTYARTRELKPHSWRKRRCFRIVDEFTGVCREPVAESGTLLEGQESELETFMNDDFLFTSFVSFLLFYFINPFPLNPLWCYCQLDTSYWLLAPD
jgi:hypothetical protein